MEKEQAKKENPEEEQLKKSSDTEYPRFCLTSKYYWVPSFYDKEVTELSIWIPRYLISSIALEWQLSSLSDEASEFITGLQLGCPEEFETAFFDQKPGLEVVSSTLSDYCHMQRNVIGTCHFALEKNFSTSASIYTTLRNSFMTILYATEKTAQLDLHKGLRKAPQGGLQFGPDMKKTLHDNQKLIEKTFRMLKELAKYSILDSILNNQ